MYNFYKVKSKRNQQEFRHPFFRREQASDLKYIKRKNVNKKLKQSIELSPCKEELLTSTNINIKEQIDKLQGVLDFIAEQNRTLTHTNKTIVSHLFSSKGLCESQIREFIAMMFVTISVSNTNLQADFKNFLNTLKINQGMIPNSVFLERNIANVDAILQNSGDKSLSIPVAMEKLLGIYKSHLIEKPVAKHMLFIKAPEPQPAKRQAFAVIANHGNATIAPQKSHNFSELLKVPEIQKTIINQENANLKPQRKHIVSDNKICSLVSLKHEGVVEDLNRADYLFNNHFNEKDNDLVSLSDFVYSPVTPLFQEDF